MVKFVFQVTHWYITQSVVCTWIEFVISLMLKFVVHVTICHITNGEDSILGYSILYNLWFVLQFPVCFITHGESCTWGCSLLCHSSIGSYTLTIWWLVAGWQNGPSLRPSTYRASLHCTAHCTAWILHCTGHCTAWILHCTAHWTAWILHCTAWTGMNCSMCSAVYSV